jgi:ketosteroid isomerase-like protein
MKKKAASCNNEATISKGGIKMRKHIIFLVIVTFAFCLYVTPSANAATAEEEELQVAVNWNKAMNNADFELMSSLYFHSPKTSEFAPNKAGGLLIQGWEALEKWWKGNLGLPKGTFVNTQSNIQVTMITNDVAVITCYQTLIVNPPAAKEQSTDLIRNTRVVQKIDGKWLIMHDHASLLPNE